MLPKQALQHTEMLLRKILSLIFADLAQVWCVPIPKKKKKKDALFGSDVFDSSCITLGQAWTGWGLLHIDPCPAGTAQQ